MSNELFDGYNMFLPKQGEYSGNLATRSKKCLELCQFTRKWIFVWMKGTVHQLNHFLSKYFIYLAVKEFVEIDTICGDCGTYAFVRFTDNSSRLSASNFH